MKTTIENTNKNKDGLKKMEDDLQKNEDDLKKKMKTTFDGRRPLTEENL